MMKSARDFVICPAPIFWLNDIWNIGRVPRISEWYLEYRKRVTCQQPLVTPPGHGASVHGGGRGRARGARDRDAALPVSLYGAAQEAAGPACPRPGDGPRRG